MKSFLVRLVKITVMLLMHNPFEGLPTGCMAMTKSNGEKLREGEETTDPDLPSCDESDDEEVLEESPCGRWQKRREEVSRCILEVNVW